MLIWLFLNSRLIKRFTSSTTGLRSPRSRTCMRSSWSRVLSPKLRKYPWVFPRGLQQQGLHQVKVGAVVHAEFEGDSGNGVGQRPVDQLPGDEGFVRDNDVLAVEVGDGGGADADLAHRA